MRGEVRLLECCEMVAPAEPYAVQPDAEGRLDRPHAPAGAYEEPVRKAVGYAEAILLEVHDERLLVLGGWCVAGVELLRRQEAAVRRQGGIVDITQEDLEGVAF